MKFNKNTLLLSLLTLAAATQPAYGMYENVKKSLNNNPYVKYGTAVVAGVGVVGAGIWYYMAQPEIAPKQEELQIPVSLCFKKNKTYDALCSKKDLIVCQQSPTGKVISVDEQLLTVYCYSQNKYIQFKITKADKLGASKKFDMEFYDYEWKPYLEKTVTLQLKDIESIRPILAFND
jgi:hypothetical protein